MKSGDSDNKEGGRGFPEGPQGNKGFTTFSRHGDKGEDRPKKIFKEEDRNTSEQGESGVRPVPNSTIGREIKRRGTR